MIKILHVVSTLSKSSGVMSFIMNYYRHINKENIQFNFLYWTDEQESYIGEIREMGGEVYKIAKPSLSLNFFKDFIHFSETDMNKQSIIHLHENYLNIIMKCMTFTRKKVPIISHAHTTKYSDKYLNAMRNRILCLPIDRTTDYSFACSEDAAKLYFKNYSTTKIIKNAVDLDHFSFDKENRMEIRKSLGIDNKFVVMHIGRFNKQKNHEKTIDIFVEILKRKNDSVLILVGSGPLQEQVKNKIKTLNIQEKVLFLNQRDDINNLLKGADVFLLPSFFEGLGIVLIEAQASGLPCVASDKVPKEAKVTDRLEFLSLNLDSSAWAEKAIISSKKFSRTTLYKPIQKAGYDIKYEIQKLENEYFSMLER